MIPELPPEGETNEASVRRASTPTNSLIPTELNISNGVVPTSWQSYASSSSQLTLSPMVNLHDLLPSFPNSSTTNTNTTSITHTKSSSHSRNASSRILLLPSSLNNNNKDSSEFPTFTSIITEDTSQTSFFTTGGGGGGISFSSSSSSSNSTPSIQERCRTQTLCNIDVNHCHSLAKKARELNDTMVYLAGPRVYTCNECRTHFTSHDEILSKHFHGRHGRAYLFDQCVNVTLGPPEDRRLITGLHTVCDIFCRRCETLVGWTYTKAYEPSQKYKEGKFIIEKIFLHMEESDCFDVDLPAGVRRDKWKLRSMSWSEEGSILLRQHRRRLDDDKMMTMMMNNKNNKGMGVFEYDDRSRSRTLSTLSSL